MQGRIIGRLVGSFCALFVSLPVAAQQSATCEVDRTVAKEVSAASYTVLLTDQCKMLVFTNNSAVAVTLPDAGVVFPSGYRVSMRAQGSGTVTVTPQDSTINGGGAIDITSGTGADFWVNDGNYYTQSGSGGSTAGMLRDASNVDLPDAQINFQQQVTPAGYGAACDVVSGTNGSMTSGSAVLTIASGTIPESAIGKAITVSGAGAAPFSSLTISSTIANAGTGYAANDTVTLTGGTFSQAVIIHVLTVGGSGEILTYSAQDAGVYTVKPSNPVAQGSSSGAGVNASFNLQFVGSPISGTIVSASGTNQETLSTTAGNTIASIARWAYGTDDTVALQAMLDAVKTTGAAPGMALIPGVQCGITAQLELPVVGAGVASIGQGELSGSGDHL